MTMTIRIDLNEVNVEFKVVNRTFPTCSPS